MTRAMLPQRRSVFRLDTVFNDLAYTIEFGLAPGDVLREQYGLRKDGARVTFEPLRDVARPLRVAEVFINCAKTTSAQAANARDAAILISLALQHGVTLDTLRHGLTRDQTYEGKEPPSSIAGHALDLVAAELTRMGGPDEPVAPEPDVSPTGGAPSDAAVASVGQKSLAEVA